MGISFKKTASPHVENAHTIIIQIHGRWTANAQEAIFTVFGSNCRGGINAFRGNLSFTYKLG